MSEYLEVYKILVVGLDGDERTNFLEKISERFLEGELNNNTKNTIGVDFNLMSLTIENNGREYTVGFQLWDMSGEIRYKSMREYYVPGTQGLIFCVIKGDINELNYLNEWAEDIHKYVKKSIPKILIRTVTDSKKDTIPEKNRKNIEKFIKKWQIDGYFETSADTGENFENALKELAKYCVSW